MPAPIGASHFGRDIEESGWHWAWNSKKTLEKIIFFANVRDHRHRTAGATDAGEERASASGVTAGRCSVDRIVRAIFVYSGKSTPSLYL
jgi:hypothetical protein